MSLKKLIFASLLCHRDVDFFCLNWFTMRAYLDEGFKIPHLVLSDGSLTEADFQKLEQLPNVWIEKEKVQLHNVPKAVYLAKLECFKVGFQKYGADRVVIMDADIFFFKNWEADLRKICMSSSIVLRDWGSSLGPHPKEYRMLFGVHEDVLTPNCNTGFNSISSDQYCKIQPVLDKHLSSPFVIMEDQGITFAAFYGQLDYVKNIKCCINGGESDPNILNWWLSQNACHLMGMRERPFALKAFVQTSINNLPEYLHLSQFPPTYRHVGFGLMEYGTYSFKSELHNIPSTYQGTYITDALYLHGGSLIVWKLPPRCKRFKAKAVCLDSGIKANCHAVKINGQDFKIDSEIDIPLSGSLEMVIPDGGGTHYAFLEPKIQIDKTMLSLPN